VLLLRFFCKSLIFLVIRDRVIMIWLEQEFDIFVVELLERLHFLISRFCQRFQQVDLLGFRDDHFLKAKILLLNID